MKSDEGYRLRAYRKTSFKKKNYVWQNEDTSVPPINFNFSAIVGAIVLVSLIFFAYAEQNYNSSNNVIYQCGNITASGNYTLNTSFTQTGYGGSCIKIYSSNVTIEGKGYNISSNAYNSSGVINFNQSSNITIRNLGIFGFQIGFNFTNSTNLTLSGILSNASTGIKLQGVNLANITNAQLFSNNESIIIYNSTNITIEGTNITSRLIGVNITNSSWINFISSNISSANQFGAFLYRSDNNSFERAYWNFNNYSVYLTNSTYNNFLNSKINNSIWDAIIFGSGSGENNFTNVTFINTSSKFYDINYTTFLSDHNIFTDTIINNYSFGTTGNMFLWRNYSIGEKHFVNRITGFGNTLYKWLSVANNSVNVNSSITALNTSANVTFWQMPGNLTNAQVFKNGALCPIATCTNLTDLNQRTASFNVASWSEYQILSDARQYNVTLNAGWNYFSIVLPNVTDATTNDRNVSVTRGWNLIGYSGLVGQNISNLRFANNSNPNTTYTWDEASNKQIIQYPMVLWNNSVDFRGYRYILDNQTGFSNLNAYWVRVNQTGNITFPNVAGNKFTYLSGEFENGGIAFSNLTFANSTSTLNITDAFSNGWIGEPEVTIDDVIGYWRSRFNRFEFVSSAGKIFSWNGYFIYSQKNNITLIIGV